ncbi:MAG: cyclic pyranopterin monophosphate synthase MoaC [Myxococcales bacterium]|nr:cyclic pyranopterin monophosphate synthase MoaC [Myxococcales bacterium]
MSDLPHLDARGEAHMVAVGDKARTHRRATAQGYVRMSPAGIDALSSGTGRKGDALAVARVAGIMAAKRTSDLIPLCHPIALSSIQVELRVQGLDQLVFIEATVEAEDRTGVEMEALTAVNVGLLTIYDMCKAVDRGMRMEGIQLMEKLGGKSGHWKA